MSLLIAMDGYLAVLAFALFLAFGNIVGGLLAEAISVSARVLSLALHAAAGVVLSVVAVELLPQALAAQPPWLIIGGFVAGGLFFAALDQTIDLVQGRKGAAKSASWAIYAGMLVDLFSDGILIGTGATVAISLGFLLALSQIPANVPEGFATIANFKKQGMPRRTRLLLLGTFTLPILAGATAGYWLVRGQPEALKFGLLAFTAGSLTTFVVEEIIPEAHHGQDARLAAIVFVGGFALFALLSAYVG